jgi:transcriptional regulator with XRE-family HTH domain
VDRKTVAKRILTLLEARGMNQKDLSILAGISRASISNIIAGRYCSEQMVRTIAQALDVEFETLTGEDMVQIYKDLDALLFSDCIVIVAKVLDREKLQVGRHNDIVKLALDLYKRHLDGITDVRKHPREAEIFVEGILNYQLSLGVVRRKDKC